MEKSDDFQRITTCGGRLKFQLKTDDGQQGYTVSYEQDSPYPASLFGIYALIPHGIPYSAFTLGHNLTPWDPPIPPGCIPVFILSDREGFFGRKCPACGQYFRHIARSHGIVHCPYCIIKAPVHHFLTDEQKSYIKAYADKFCETIELNKDSTIEIDGHLEQNLDDAQKTFAYSETKQQTRFKCERCGCTTDILGQYGSCPSCGKRNTLQIFLQRLTKLEDMVNNPRYTSQQRQERDDEWRDITKQCVSYFEGFARDLTSILARIPATPARKKSITGISFHNPITAASKLKSFFDIDILNSIDNHEQSFLHKRFLRRHIYEHSSGIADNEYIQKSGDSVKNGQLLREKSSNVLTLINLVRKIATNYDIGFSSIS